MKTTEKKSEKTAGKATSLRSKAKRLGVALSSLQAARDAGRVTISEDVEAMRRQWLASTSDMGPDPLITRGEGLTDAVTSVTSEVTGPGEAVSYSEAKRRHQLAVATLRETELLQLQGRLVWAHEVRKKWADELGAARSRLLAIPTRLKQAIPTLTVGEVVIVEDLVREALEDLVAQAEADTEATP